MYHVNISGKQAFIELLVILQVSLRRCGNAIQTRQAKRNIKETEDPGEDPLQFTCICYISILLKMNIGLLMFQQLANVI